MPSPAKYHQFEYKNFQGLVYCDYCEKLLWGFAQQGMHCTECGYNCHSECSKMVVQCRPRRRVSPDSLSVTDSEAESLSKYSSPARLTMSPTSTTTTPDERQPRQRTTSTTDPHDRTQHRSTSEYLDGALRSPSLPPGAAGSVASNTPTLTLNSSVKAYRKSLKQHVQNTIIASVPLSSSINANGALNPQATAKAFTRVVARSRAFFNLSHWVYDIYAWKHSPTSFLCVIAWIVVCLYPSLLLILPPALVGWLYIRVGIQSIPASQALVPRYDENSPEYFTNLESTQQSMLFIIRLYDNLSYHCQHITLTPISYQVMLITAAAASVAFYLFGRWIVLVLGLVILLNKTWVGAAAEVGAQFIIELLQTTIDLFSRVVLPSKASPLKPIIVSVYENQRWWAGSGYTSQLLRSERGGWSNLTGSEPLPSKDEMPPPPSYQWDEGMGWELDLVGPWTDEQLGIGKPTIVECDEKGWVYTDHRWQNARSRPDRTSKTPDADRPLTRRRHWIRKAYPINTKTTKKLA